MVALLLFTAHQLAAQETLTKLSDSFELLAAKVSPAVVQILANGYGTGDDTDSGGSSLTRRQQSGSGVIVDAQGYIVTNAHVVSGARNLKVVIAFSESHRSATSILKSKGKLLDGRVIGIDSETDLAVLKIQSETPAPFLELGNSDSLRPGQIVLAFGSPLGLDNSVSMGVISAVARQLKPEDPMIYVQTDAPINPGNSGGPLVDTDGRVVGINTSIYSYSGGSEGIGFAAPSNIVRNVYEQLRKNGIVRRGEIGVSAQTITPALAAGLSLPQDWGVICGDVTPSSPAELAGIKIGDLILTIDGKIVENGRQFDVNLYRRSEKDSVTIEVLRGTEKLTFQVPVTVREDDRAKFAGKLNPQTNTLPRLGVVVLEMDDDVARLLPGLRKQYGVVVAARTADAPYWAGQFQPGDVIHAVNGTLITGLSQIRGILDGLKPGSAVAVQVERSGKMFYAAFELE